MSALLSEIALQRELRDEAFDAAERPKAAWLESGELMRRAQGAQDGLESMVLDALGDEHPPSVEELAGTSGFPPEYVEELAERRAAAVAAADAGPAPKRRWFRR